MARSHREAVLAASCVQTPVHPHTRAPLTLYERLEEDRQRLAAAAKENPGRDDFTSCSEDGEEGYKSGNCKNWVLDLSKIQQSDKEYCMQIERLKNAHMYNMEQLEKMYDNKLNLKGVQSTDHAVKSNSWPAWEQKTSHAHELTSCLLKHDINWNTSSGISEASFKEQSDEEDSCETQVSANAGEKIREMWHGFHIQDYIKNTEFLMPKRKTNKNESKDWSHRVTIPEPFEMTIRESKKKEMNVKSKSEIELENKLLKKRLEEEAECQKKFRANPVPASVYLPLYYEIVERNDLRRKFVKERCKELLLASQKPFQFIEREAHKKQLRKMHLDDFQDSINNCNHFKARPVPKSIYGTSINERLKEEELYRGIRIHMRSQELLHSSSYPTRTLACRSSRKSRKGRCYEPEKEKEHRPKINTQIPNFQVLHHNNQEHLLKSKNTKHVTICDPFYLRTDNIASHKTRILQDIEADEVHLKETRWPYKSPRSQPQKHAAILSPRAEAPAVSPRSTELSKRREADVRRSEKKRTEEYLQDLDAMKERVSQTPLLMERTKQKNARLCTEKHYSSVLRDLNSFDDFLLTNGQTDHTSAMKDPNTTKEDEVNSSDEHDKERSSQDTLEIEDLQEDCSDLETSDKEKQEYSTDEDHTDSVT